MGIGLVSLTVGSRERTRKYPSTRQVEIADPIARGQLRQPTRSFHIRVPNRVNAINLRDQSGIEDEVNGLTANQLFHLSLTTPPRGIHVDTHNFMAHERRGKRAERIP
jgi:hypothetical protein